MTHDTDTAAEPTDDTGLSVATDERGDRVVLTARGVVDYWTVAPLRERLDGALRAPTPHVVLDLRAVTFVDSTGLALLLSAQRRADDADGWLRLVAPHPQLRRVLHTTNLERRFEICPSVEQAVA